MATRGDSTALTPLIRDYLRLLFPCEDELLQELRREALLAEFPEIQISEEQGSFMQFLLRSIAAKRVLEIGTLGGYSALVMARALPTDGEVVTLEIDDSRADFAERFICKADLQHQVRILRGPALQTLDSLEAGSFDFAFIDADKPNYTRYLDRCLELVRAGGVIAADNAFAFGSVLNESDTSPDAVAIREFNRIFAFHPLLQSFIVPVGDGLAVGHVLQKR